MGYLALTKRIINNELSDEELIECLKISNVSVIQQAILQIIEKSIQNSDVHIKLLEYSRCMDIRFKLVGLCRIGHLAIYALKRLGYKEDFKELYAQLSEEDKEQVLILERAFS